MPSLEDALKSEVRRCSIEGCEKSGPVYTPSGYHANLCYLHADRYRKHGDPMGGQRYGKAPADGLCTIADCDRPYKAKGLCASHYQILQIEGDPNRPIKIPRRNSETCLYCDEPPHARDLCSTHYSRYQRGKPMEVEVIPLGQPRINWSDEESVRGVNITGAHARIYKLWGKASQFPCVKCDGPATEWAYDGTDPTQKLGQHGSRKGLMWFSVYPEFYMPMCASCHRTKDRELLSNELYEYRVWMDKTGLKLSDLDEHSSAAEEMVTA